MAGVEVMLRNAVELSPDMDWVGVQLGQDFFLTARFCAVDVIGDMEGQDSNGAPMECAHG